MKDKYRELCKNNDSIPLFLRDYWMDLFDNSWDVMLYEKSDKILGTFVYTIKKKFGIKYISMPKMTQYNGIWINYPDNIKIEKKISLENEVSKYFIEKIKEMNIKYYMQTFSTNFTNWLSFYWNDFKCQPNYTYVIKHRELNSIWDNMASTLRNEIKRADEEAEIFECNDDELFYSLLKKTYERQAQVPRITYEEYCQFNKAMNEHNLAYVIGAKDKQNNVHSICYFVIDNKKMYYLMSGNDCDFRKSNFNSLLIWKGIEKANELGLDFDFEGSMNENINSFMRKFGGELTTYYKLSKVLTKNPFLKYIIMKKMK